MISGLQVGSPLLYSRQAHYRERWLRELSRLIAFPTVSAQPSHRQDIEAAAYWLKNQLARLGLHHTQILPPPDGGLPSVYADWLLAPGQPTLLLYGHFDVQPVEPLEDWQTPPFQATHKGDNLYGRGVSDDKGQFWIHLKALESYLATLGRLPLNIKVWLESEEEINSPSLPALLRREAARLQADAVLISDTAMVAEGQPSIIYGLRGNLSFELEVSGPAHDLHAGRFGGAVHNPLQALCEIIARLHDRQARITIPDFYRQVRELEPSARQELGCGTPGRAEILEALDLPTGWGEHGYSLFERMTIRPALVLNGLSGGYTGPGSKMVLPHGGLARLSLRLVPEQNPAEIADLLQRHIATLKPPAVSTRLTIGGSAAPVLIERRHPVMFAAARAIYKTWGVPPVFTRSGGTIGVVGHFGQVYGVPVVLMGFGLPNDDVHAPNEKISLPNFFKGVETVIRFLAEYADEVNNDYRLSLPRR